MEAGHNELGRLKKVLSPLSQWPLPKAVEYAPPGLAKAPAATVCLNHPLKIPADQEPPRSGSASVRRSNHSPHHSVLLALYVAMWSSPRHYNQQV